MGEQMHTSNILKIEQRDPQQKKGRPENPEENDTNHAVDIENIIMKVIVKSTKLELLLISYLLIHKIYMGVQRHDGL